MSVLLQWSSSMITCSAERPLPILTSIVKKPLHRAPKFQGISLQKYPWKSAGMSMGTECFWFHSPERIFPCVNKLSWNVKLLMWRTDSVWKREGWVSSNLAVIQQGLMTRVPGFLLYRRFSTWETKCPLGLFSKERECYTQKLLDVYLSREFITHNWESIYATKIEYRVFLLAWHD